MKNETRNKLLSALERLLNGAPNNRELRLKAEAGKLKVHNSNVEKEAGLSAGALRNHEDIKKLIKNQSLELRVNQSETAASPIEVLEKDIEELKTKNKKLTELNDKHRNLFDSNKKALAVQAATHIKIVQELVEMVHESEREKLMDKIVSARHDNVVDGNFRK